VPQGKKSAADGNKLTVLKTS